MSSWSIPSNRRPVLDLERLDRRFAALFWSWAFHHSDRSTACAIPPEKWRCPRSKLRHPISILQFELAWFGRNTLSGHQTYEYSLSRPSRIKSAHRLLENLRQSPWRCSLWGHSCSVPKSPSVRYVRLSSVVCSSNWLISRLCHTNYIET